MQCTIVACTAVLVGPVLFAAAADDSKKPTRVPPAVRPSEIEGKLIASAVEAMEQGKDEDAYRLLSRNLPGTKGENGAASDGVVLARRATMVAGLLRNRDAYAAAERLATMVIERERGSVKGLAKSKGRAAALYEHAWLSAKILGRVSDAAALLDEAAADDPDDLKIRSMRQQLTRRSANFPAKADKR